MEIAGAIIPFYVESSMSKRYWICFALCFIVKDSAKIKDTLGLVIGVRL